MNRGFGAARAAKQDEFYTQYVDIQKEVEAYLEFDPETFRGEVVYCNCDDPRVSNFFKYFINNFEKLGLKKVITTCYKNGQPDLWSQNKSPRGIYFEYSGEQKKQRLACPAALYNIVNETYRYITARLN